MDVAAEKITDCQAQGEEGQAYTGNSCGIGELIKVPDRKLVELEPDTVDQG